jgi:tetratricopeptide (TPR) repeat protein
MPRADFKKLLQQGLKNVSFMKDYTEFPPYAYAKENDSVLSIVSFDPGTVGFTCVIAVQPLVVPNREGVVALSFGVTLTYFGGLRFERWHYGNTKQETEKNIQEAIDLLVKVGTPWLEKNGNEKAIVNYPINDGTLLHCPPQIRNIYRGYCALHLGQIEKGVNWLKEAISYFEKIKQDWADEQVTELNEAIEMAKDGQSNRLKEYLDSIVKASRDAVFTNNLRVMKR